MCEVYPCQVSTSSAAIDSRLDSVAKVGVSWVSLSEIKELDKSLAVTVEDRLDDEGVDGTGMSVTEFIETEEPLLRISVGDVPSILLA